MKRNTLSQERVRELFEYAEDGWLIWRESRGRAAAGQRAGWVNSNDGYVYVEIDKTAYKAHRLIWIWFFGEIITPDVDHKNRDRSDNRITNLRPATRSQNATNRKKKDSCTSKWVGVYWYERYGCWKAQINNGRVKHLGFFDDETDAAKAYNEAARKAFGEFANLNCIDREIV